MQVFNVSFYCQVQEKVRPPMHEYIRKLVYKDLSKTTIEKVLRQMRRLPWDDDEVNLLFMIHCFPSLLILFTFCLKALCQRKCFASRVYYCVHVDIDIRNTGNFGQAQADLPMTCEVSENWTCLVFNIILSIITLWSGQQLCYAI